MVDSLLLIPPSLCFLWASAKALSCSCASSRSRATSSCLWPSDNEQEEETSLAWTAFFFLASLQGVEVVSRATPVCIQNTSFWWWHWTEVMTGMEQEQRGREVEWFWERPVLLRPSDGGVGSGCSGWGRRSEGSPARPHQGKVERILVERGVCVCASDPRLIWLSPSIWSLDKDRKHTKQQRKEENYYLGSSLHCEKVMLWAQSPYGRIHSRNTLARSQAGGWKINLIFFFHFTSQS